MALGTLVRRTGDPAPLRDSRIVLNDDIICVGALGNLTITIFASGSYFDRVITSGFEGCEILAFNVSRSRANASGEMALVNLSGETRGYGCQISNLSLSYG